MIDIIGKTEIIEAMVSPELFPDIELNYCNKHKFQIAFNERFPECDLCFNDISINGISHILDIVNNPCVLTLAVVD